MGSRAPQFAEGRGRGRGAGWGAGSQKLFFSRREKTAGEVDEWVVLEESAPDDEAPKVVNCG